MSLSSYQQKRNFVSTREPRGVVKKSGRFRFVVQEHHATQLHYDFRLELGGVLKSWAVPKGPSMNPSQKRLAVQVEDHPVEYINFKGVIPPGNYGAGKVSIWDQGSFEPLDKNNIPLTEKKALQSLRKGELKFILHGKKLKGSFVLVQLKNQEKNWLLIKHHESKTVSHPSTAIKKVRKGNKKMRHYIKPMLATLTNQPFDNKEWLFEIKWDGYRAIAVTGASTPLLYSRNGLNFSERFSPITLALQKIKIPAVLDGEIVLLNENNEPDFQKLQNYEENNNLPLLYYVFDILELNHKNTENLSLVERKKLLKKLIGTNRVIRFSDHITEKGIAFFKAAKKKGLEGIIAKKKDSVYHRGYRSTEWLKIKNVQEAEVIIAGYTAPKGSRQGFGSLIVASRESGKLKYRGHVGTGFNGKTLAILKRKMDALKSHSSPFQEAIPLNGKPTWLKPELIAEISYGSVTKDAIFRHPVFIRLRDDKTVKEINSEILNHSAMADKKSQKVGSYKVQLTNLSKIYWPEEGITKGELIEYYDSMASFILPYLKKRPLSLKRNPNGIMDEGFYHKDAGENAPPFATVYPVHSSSSDKVIDYLVCNNKASLLYLANLGCIEMNPWNSTITKPDHPTWLVIDIDPSEKNNFGQVIEVTLATKEICDKAALNCCCKTSGATGMHVYIPLHNKYDYDTVKDFAQLLATLIHEQVPGITSLERSKTKRGKKIYIDYLQNRKGQTLAAPYSVRPVPEALISTPLSWKELKKDLSPHQFTIKNILSRVKKTGDLFQEVIRGTNSLQKAIRLLNL